MSDRGISVECTKSPADVHRLGMLVRLLSIVAVLGLVAGACGDDGDDTAPDTTDQTDDGGASTDGTDSGTDDGTTTDADTDDGTTTDADTGGEATEGGDGLPADADPDGVIRLGYDLVHAAAGGFYWDPTQVTTAIADDGLFSLVYGTFLRRDAAGDLVPDLAESTEVVDDTTIVVHLREGETFSDGTPFDADVVKTGLERTLAEGNPAAIPTTFFDLETVEATDPTTVTLTLSTPTAASWHDTHLARWEMSIVHPDLQFDRPIGAGPMVVADFQREQSAVLEKNPTYWDAEHILVAGIEMLHVPDPVAAAGALGADQVDMAQIDTTQVAALRGDDDVILQADADRMMSLMVCKRDEPLSDPNVRLALNKAIDRQTISDAVFEGTFIPALGIYPPDSPFHDPSLDDVLAYDPQAARDLLADAGYEDGIEFDIYVIGSGGLPDVTAIMQQQYAEVGITANLIPSPNYVDEFLVPQTAGAGAVPVNSPGRAKMGQWSGDAVGNTCSYADPELDALVAELATYADSDPAAIDVYHQIEAKVVNEALSVLILFGTNVTGYDSAKLGNATMMPFVLPMPDVRETYVRAS